MPLDQTLGAAPDPTYDPQSIVTGLIGQQEPDLVQNGAVDPQAVLNRLIRKGLQKQSHPQGPADLSSFGKTKDELGPNAASNGETPDFASFGEPAQATAENPATGEVPVEDTGNAVSVGAKSAARGLVGSVGSTVKAAARGVPAMEQAEQGAFSPLNDTLLTNPPDQENTELFKAGGAVQKFAKDIGPTPAEEKAHPIASTVGGAIGGMGIPLALGAIDPIAGIAGGAALFGISSAEDTYEAAKEHGADDQTAAQAALLSGTVNAALGSLPVAAVFKPFEKFMPQAAGLGVRILAQAAQNGITFATVGEAQEYLGQQIAKMYDSKAGYSFDTERLIGELLAGGALGAAHAAFAGRGKASETAAQPSQTAAPQPNAGALPGPGEAGAAAETGGGPQPQPGTGGAGAQQHPGYTSWTAHGETFHTDSSTGDTYRENPQTGDWEWYSQARPGWSGQQQSAGAQPGAAQSAQEAPPPFETKLNPKIRSKLEEKAAYYQEFSPEIIASWSDDKLKDYVNTKFGFGSKRADDDEVLRRYGFTPEDVSAMSPEQKSAAVDEAMRNGVHAGEAPPQQGTREAPVDLKTGEDVAAAAAAASQDHSPAQGEAGNFRRGHATWDPAGDGNGLNLSIEVPPGGVRKGTVKGTGETWETTHPHAYGEILGVPNAADGMRPDVIVGPHPNAPNAYVIDEQDKRTGKYKQSKAFVGFLSPEEARDSYLGISSKVPEQIAAIEAFPSAQFPQLVRGGLLSGPVAGKGSAVDLHNNVTSPHGGEVGAGEQPSGTAGAAAAPGSASEGAPAPRESAETAAPAPAHHQAIEAALRAVGVDPKHIRPVDIARAAEIHAQEGYSPEDSFQLAVARAAVEDGIFTREEIAKTYGPEIAAAVTSNLASESGGSSGSGAARNERHAGAPGVARNEEPLSQSEEQKLQRLRSAGDRGLPRVAGELRDIPPGHGAAAESEAHAGQEGQQQGLQPGQLPLGNEGRAGAKHAGQPASSSGRSNAAAGRSGAEIGNERRNSAAAPLGRMGAGTGAEQAGTPETPNADVPGTHPERGGVVETLGHPTSNAGQEAGQARPLHGRGAAALEVALRNAGVDADGVRRILNGELTAREVNRRYGSEAAKIVFHARKSLERGLRSETSSAGSRGQIATREDQRISGGGAHGAQGGAGEAENAPRAEPARTEERPRNAGRRNEREAAGAGHPESGRPAAEQRAAGGERHAEREREPAHGGKAAPEREAPKASTAPLIGDRVESLPEHKVTAADGTSVKVVPVVLDAAKLITSSDEGYDKEIQPRQRERAASQAQIREIATRLDPERLGYSAEADRGAPIVGPDRMVESGNGRVQAIRAVYAHNPKNTAKYRSWLKEQGVDVAKYKDPILVRQRVTDLDQEERKAFAVASNQAATLSMSAPERALADADHISPHMLGLLADGDLNSLENRKFVRAFVGALPATERGALSTPEGGLSAEGLPRVRNAILAKAYGDPDIVSRITESTDDDVKSISNALVASAPLWAKLRSDIEEGRVPEEFDLTKDLMEAVKRTADMRGKGQKLEEYLAQQDAFDHIELNVDGFIRNFYDPGTKRAKSGQRIADFLRFYATEAAKVSSEAGLDLGMAKVKPNEIQAAAAKKTEASGGSGVRPGVAAERNEKQRPGAGKSSRLAAAKKFGRSKFRGHKLGLPDDLFGAEPGAGKSQSRFVGSEYGSAELTGVANRNTSPAEDVDDRIRPDAEFLRDATQRPAFRKRGLSGLDAPLQRKVLARVFAAGQDPKILQSIIKTVPVDVVNVLGGGKLSAEGLFHDEAVFRNLLAANGNSPVPIGIDAASALVRAVARASAIGLPLRNIAGVSADRSAASGAGDKNHSSNIEQTPAGKQYIIPGAEQRSSAELAKRRAAEPLKPRVAQKPLESGLFGDAHKQTDLFESASKKGPAGFAAGAEEPTSFIDLGKFETAPDAQIGREAQAYVAERGRETGLEHLVAFDTDGSVVAHGRGTEKGIGLSPTLEEALRDPNRSIIVHHNHPTNTSLSVADIGMLGFPGQAAIWAHGDHGVVSRGSLTAAARSSLSSLPVDGRTRKLTQVASEVDHLLLNATGSAIERGAVSVDEANAAIAHIVATALNRAGVLDYRSNIDAADFIARAGLEPYLDRGARLAARSMFNGEPAYRNDGRPAALQHPGDLGATFGGTRTPAEWGALQSGKYQAGQATHSVAQSPSVNSEGGATKPPGYEEPRIRSSQQLTSDQAKSAEGMPSLEATSGETGGASNTSRSEAPPEIQPLPGAQVSTSPAPFSSSTTRETPPSIFPAASTLRFSGVIGDIDQASKKYILQGSNDINALRQAAGENKPRLEARLSEIAAGIPGTRLMGARVKDLPGLMEKVHAKGRAPNTISDYLGARVVTDTPAAMREFLQRLHETGGVIEAENFLDTGKNGYRGYHLQIGLGDGTSAELQVLPKPIADVLEEAHDIRQPVKLILDQTYASPEDLAKAKAVMAASKAILDRAWKAAPEWQHHGLAEGAGPIPLANTYWGGFRPRAGAPLGRQAQEYVLANGRETGREHLVGIDKSGAVAADIVGEGRSVSLPPEVVARLVDPTESVVIHHNHPRDSTLSNQDIAELGLPGVHAIWAHGPVGRTARAGLTILGRSLIADGGDPQRNVTAIGRMMRGITYGRMYDPLKEALNRGLIEKYRANDLLAHLANEVLRRAGLIDYHTNDNFEGEIEKLGLEPLIDQTALDLVRSLPNGYQAVPGESYGTRRVFRHVGDLGTSFSGVEKTPRRGTQQTGVDRQRGSSYRREEAAPAQLSLFGSPRHELHQVANAFGTAAPQRMNPLPPTAPRPISAAVSNAAVAKKFKNFWASTFQPELFSDRALEADPLFARYKSRQAQEKDAVVAQSENEWKYWNKRPDAERIRFLDDMESGRAPADATQRNMARRYRAMLDKNWELEKQFGSQAAFVEDYLPHIWEKPSEFEAFAQTRSAQVGPTWFQKKRTFDYIKEGLAAGLKLKYTNPVDIVVHRLLSGVDMRQRMDLLYKLKELGLAWEGKQGGEQLVKRGWRAINAPDRKQWVLAPDVQLLWKNGVEAKGLWQAEGAGGGIFRGWMAIKNAWVPVKLALSAFHPLHVLHIDQANTLALAWDDLTKGRNLDVALKHAGEGIATLPTLGMIHYRRGAEARTAWQKRPSQQTPEEKAIVNSMQEGGFVPQLSEQLKIAAKRQLAEAWQKIQRREAGVSDWRRFVSALMRRPMEKLQAPIFEKWIPALKAAAYLAQDAEMMRRHPEYLDDPVRRQIARRAIAKSIDNRYGEMNYNTLFWNRSLKDASIASFLSLGWNLGFVREFGGAAMETASRPLGLFEPFKPSEGRKVAREATNKQAFAIGYVATAAVIAGIMTYLFTRTQPEGQDYIFPRIGGLNPDGTPRRVTTMFYTREAPMLLKHIQEQGGGVHGILAGSKEMLWNKLMFEPFSELLNNKNYYSYEIFDPNAPFYKQIWQAFRHTYGDQFSPMSVSGAKHAANLSGKPFPSFTEALQHPERGIEALGAKGVWESALGFGPAPAYVEKSPIQNRIGYLYQQHVAPVSKPEEQGENTEEKMAVRQAIMIARRDHDSKGLQEAYARGKELGLSQTSMNRVGREATDIYLFSRLPNEDQKAILLQATPEERNRYWAKAHAAVKQQLSRQVHLPGPAQLQ